jgi:hypothetical protein
VGAEDMPVCKEFRYFIEDGRYVCSHPYWPVQSLIDGGFDLSPHDFTALCAGRTQELDQIAIAAGAAVGGAWSVDILETKRGWVVTDMAEAHKSWHWGGCKSFRVWRVATQSPTNKKAPTMHASQIVCIPRLPG